MNAQSKLMQEQSQTEGTKRANIMAQTLEQETRNKSLPERIRYELGEYAAKIRSLNANTALNMALKDKAQSDVDLNSANAQYIRTQNKNETLNYGNKWANTGLKALGYLLKK